MTGNPEILQSHNHEKTGTFAQPRLGQGEDSGGSWIRPSPMRSPRFQRLPACIHGPLLPALFLRLTSIWRSWTSGGKLCPESVSSRLWRSSWGCFPEILDVDIVMGRRGLAPSIPPVGIDLPFVEVTTTACEELFLCEAISVERDFLEKGLKEGRRT